MGRAAGSVAPVEITAAFWNEDRYKNAYFNLRTCGIKIGRGGVMMQ